jgi:hypothetical protein
MFCLEFFFRISDKNVVESVVENDKPARKMLIATFNRKNGIFKQNSPDTQKKVEVFTRTS